MQLMHQIRDGLHWYQGTEHYAIRARELLQDMINSFNYFRRLDDMWQWVPRLYLKKSPITFSFEVNFNGIKLSRGYTGWVLLTAPT